MLRWIHKLLRNEEGLTLIELIVVVAIIAILAFTITPRVLDALNNSRTNSARSIANEFHSALERFYANAGTTGTPEYPIGAAADADFAALRLLLVDTLALTNTSDNVIADLEYNAQTIGAANAVADTVTAADVAAYYCLYIVANDRDATPFIVNPRGVFENESACPAASNIDP